MDKLKLNKKGVFGLDSAKQFFVVILGIALLIFIIIVIMGTLLNTNILAEASTERNQARDVLLNTSTGATSFMSNLSPAYVVLAVVVIILILVVLVRVVGGGSGKGGTL